MKEISKDSLGDAIYRRVCQDLMRGKLRPNQKITIRGLAEALGTSSTPVRDAVQRLLRDNALEQRTVRDVRVPVLSVEEYLEISRIRAELEGLAAERAAIMATDKDVARLQRLVERNAEAIDAKRWSQANELNQQFHFALAEIANMPVLLSMLGQLWLRMGPLLSGYFSTATQDMVKRHHIIVAACAKGESELARDGMREDIIMAREGIVAYIKTLSSA
ncbi:GntR family transcriptional regulator [Seohaeicola zhoushanensis]|uniref:GntR family transcriptional regulator n=1 Tax=Seohaeicola zhoushanensis TaxID=1569283 RepID=A0A8J3GUG7_9RHOB|nr:GntR family transcriptional regulator [Seohaeicola zhoushanensis]GHF39078.1 GntR family transcriptional regulator [Seohaeicola zhoushanensis]